MLHPSRRTLEKTLDFLLEAIAVPDAESLARHVARGLPTLALVDRIRPALAALHRLAAARPGPGAAAGAARLPLTAREEEVLSWVAEGMSDRQVAAIVGASVRTVQKHLANAYAKLSVDNRTAAARRLESLRRDGAMSPLAKGRLRGAADR
jgi:DNA-binding CsgD family transcriptional regulator